MNNNMFPYNQSLSLPYETPTPAEPVLPYGCVLGMGSAVPTDPYGYIVHSASGVYFWNIDDLKWTKFLDPNPYSWAGIYTKKRAMTYLPSCPPPDHGKESPLRMYHVWYEIGGERNWVSATRHNYGTGIRLTFTYDEAMEIAEVLKARNTDAGIEAYE
jgi:hypothetical protein